MRFFTIIEIVTLAILWILVIIIIILPVLPLLVLLFTIRLLEEYIYEVLYKATRFHSEDVPWLKDDPKNRTVINSVLMMESKVDIKCFRRVIYERLCDVKNNNGERIYPRTTKYVHFGYVNNYWVEEENFRIEDHVYEWSENSIVGEKNLRDLISELGTRSVINEKKRSPWEYILIHYKEEGKTKTVIFLRSHHCLADGLSYIYFLVNHLNEAKVTELAPPKVSNMQKILLKSISIFYIPLTMIKLLFLPTDSSRLHCNKVSGKKHLTWSKPVKLEVIKAIKNKLNVTVNDVLVGCLSTDIYKFLAEHEDMSSKSVVTCFPVDTRTSMDEAKEFSNKFAVLFFDLPTSSRDPLKNVRQINHKMNGFKNSGEAHGVRTGLRILSYFLPEFAAEFINCLVINKSSIVLSNVPGPQDPVVIAGQKVEFFTFWPPQRDTVGSCISIFSYNGRVTIGAGCDDAVMSNADDLIKTFDETVKTLAKMVGIEHLAETD